MAKPSLLPDPSSFGFDQKKFPGWRVGQDEAVLRVVDGRKRINVECLPTGAGKSLLGMAVAELTGARTVVLTRRKGLQTQMIRDFEIHDVRGQSSYPCIVAPGNTVDVGPCHAGVPCQYRNGGCGYYDDLKEAQNPDTRVTVTNYAFWFTQARRGRGLGQVDFLVCDEAHGILDELSSFLTIEIERWEIERLGLTWPEDNAESLESWRVWCRERGVPKAEDELKAVQAGEMKSSPAAVRERRRLESLIERMKSLSGAEGEWALDMSDRGGKLRGCPVWPGAYLERYLFTGASSKAVPKILMMSATIRPKALELLGLKDADYDFHEVQSSFPLDRRLVWCIDAPRMSHRSDEGDKGLWLDRIDQVLKLRLDRKVIIHVGSYDRRNMLMQQSRYRQHMLGHSRGDVEEMIERFKRARPPAIMVSQSMTEGYDFPYGDCEAQIIAKIPYPDSRDSLIAARQRDDKEYGSFVAMQAVVQASGRGMRAADDFCETIVVDGQSRWFFRKNAQYAPQWFNDSVRQVDAPPLPKTKLPERVGVG